MIHGRFLLGVLRRLAWFRRWHRAPIDPLDELYDRLEIESKRLVADKIEQFNQTAHES